MLVDVVLVVDGQYWRALRTWTVLPACGAVVEVLTDLDATMVGSTDLAAEAGAGGVAAGAAVAVLLRVTAGAREDRGNQLTRAGWRQLL